MQITFTQTPEAYLSFCTYMAWTDPAKKRFRLQQRFLWGILSLLPYACLLFFSETLRISSYAGVTLFGVLFFLIGFLSAKSLALAHCASYVHKMTRDPLNNKLFGLVTLQLETGLVRWKSDGAKGSFTYDHIQKKIETDRYYFLMLSANSAWIIPKTALVNDAQREEFLHLLKQGNGDHH